jgi:hypothetical protein
MAVFLAAFTGIVAPIFPFYNTDYGITMPLPYKAVNIPESRLFSCVIARFGKAAKPR